MPLHSKHRSIAAGIAVVLVIGSILAIQHFEVQAVMNRTVEGVRNAGPWTFFGAMAVLPALGFPLSAFLAAAGSVFGPTLGLGPTVLGALVAVLINLVLAYAVTARAVRPVAERIVRRFGHTLPALPARVTWIAILIVRIVPGPPFAVQNIVLGLARVPFGIYLSVSMLVTGTQAIAMIVLGDGVVRGDPWAIAGAAAMFVVMGAVLHVLRKRLRLPSAAVTDQNQRS